MDRKNILQNLQKYLKHFISYWFKNYLYFFTASFFVVTDIQNKIFQII